jgi:hypothetical protein
MRFQDLRAPQKLALAFTAVLCAIVATGAVRVLNQLSRGGPPPPPAPASPPPPPPPPPPPRRC